MTSKDFAGKLDKRARGTMSASRGTRFLTAGEGQLAPRPGADRG